MSTTGEVVRQRPRLDALAVSVMVLLCTLWGVQQVGTKVAIQGGLPPLLQATIRSAVATGLLLLWVLARDGRRGIETLLARDGSMRPGLLIAALFGGEFVLLFSGVQHTTASRAVLLLYTAPFFTALGAHLLLPGEKLRPVPALGLLLAFAGVAVTMADAGPVGGSLWGDALMVGAAATWGITTVAVKASPALGRVPTAKLLLWQIGGSVPILLAAALATGQVIVPHATPLAWASLAYQSVIVAFASYLAWFWLVTRYPAGRLSAFTFLTPLIGVAAAAALLGERATMGLVVGLGCVVAGLWLVNRR